MDFILLHDGLDISNFCGGKHRLGVCGHDVGHGFIEKFCLPFFHGSADVSIGDETCYLSLFESNAQAQFSFAYVNDGFAQVHVPGKDGQIVGAHDVLGGGEKTFAEFTSGMKLSEVFGLEVSHLHEGNGQGISHGQCGSGTARGCEVEGAGFFGYFYSDVCVAIFGQERLWVAAHADDGNIAAQDSGDEAEEFVGLSGVAQGEDDIVGGHHAEIAVVDVKWVDEEGWCAGAGEGGSDFSSDVSAFAYTGNDDLSGAVKHHFDGLIEVLVELWDEVEQGLGLVSEALRSVGSDIFDSVG